LKGKRFGNAPNASYCFSKSLYVFNAFYKIFQVGVVQSKIWVNQINRYENGTIKPSVF